MITTVTLNAAIDRTQIVPNFTPGRRHRATEAVALAGGHGITIARALKRLGHPVASTGMVGGISGRMIRERLSYEGLLHDFLEVSGSSRTSSAVIDPIGGETTEINEYGPEITPDELAAFSRQLDYLAGASELVVLAGSLPQGLASTTYQQLVRQLKRHDVLTVVSSLGDAQTFGETLQAEPSLAVVSQVDAEELVGHEFSTDDDFMTAFDTMVRSGGQSIVITTADGVYARVKVGKAVTYATATIEPTEVVSRLGGSDVFVAGYLTGFFNDDAPIERIMYGAAAVISNMRSAGAGIFDTSDLKALRDRVEVRELVPV